jgi:hypothetical protein
MAQLPFTTEASGPGLPVGATGTSGSGPSIAASSMSVSILDFGSWVNYGSCWSLWDRVQDEMDATALAFVRDIPLHRKF